MVIKTPQPQEQGKKSAFALRKEVKELPFPAQQKPNKQTAKQQEKAAAWGSSISEACSLGMGARDRELPRNSVIL